MPGNRLMFMKRFPSGPMKVSLAGTGSLDRRMSIGQLVFSWVWPIPAVTKITPVQQQGLPSSTERVFLLTARTIFFEWAVKRLFLFHEPNRRDRTIMRTIDFFQGNPAWSKFCLWAHGKVKEVTAAMVKERNIDGRQELGSFTFKGRLLSLPQLTDKILMAEHLLSKRLHGKLGHFLSVNHQREERSSFKGNRSC